MIEPETTHSLPQSSRACPLMVLRTLDVLSALSGLPAQMVQWSLGAAQSHVVLYATMQMIASKVIELEAAGRRVIPRDLTTRTTGPRVLTDAALRSYRLSGRDFFTQFRQRPDPSGSKLVVRSGVDVSSPQEAIVLQHKPDYSHWRQSSEAEDVGASGGNNSSVALVLGFEVLQRRYICHNFLGSWRWQDKPWSWHLTHRWRDQWRGPCEGHN